MASLLQMLQVHKCKGRKFYEFGDIGATIAKMVQLVAWQMVV